MSAIDRQSGSGGLEWEKKKRRPAFIVPYRAQLGPILGQLPTERESATDCRALRWNAPAIPPPSLFLLLTFFCFSSELERSNLQNLWFDMFDSLILLTKRERIFCS